MLNKQKINDLTLIDKQEHIKLWQNSKAAAIVSKKSVMN